MVRYIHPHSLVPWEWLYHGTIYPPPLFSSMGVIISWYDISTPLFSSMGVIISWYDKKFNGWGDDTMTFYFHYPQYLIRGWLYCDIYSFPTIFGEGVIISRHYIFTPDNIWWGGDYSLTSYFRFPQYLGCVCVWLYRDLIFSLLTIFGEGWIISWDYIFTPDNIWWGG